MNQPDCDTFSNGDVSTNSESFDGIHELIPAGQTLSMGTNGAAVTFDKLDELIDTVQPGKPDVLFMAKATRRKLKALRRTDGISTENALNEFGQQVETYDGIPIVVDDFIDTTQTQGTAVGTTTSIYAVKFGQGIGVMGLEHGGIQIETVGELETKDATRHRIKWYNSLALFSELGAAKLIGILN